MPLPVYPQRDKLTSRAQSEAGQTIRVRPRSAPQASSAPAASTTGNTTSFTVAQPKLASSMPEENEPIAIEPKTRKSLKACTLLRSFGRWHCVTMVVAPMKAKFQPTPSSVSPIQKCQIEMPGDPDRGGDDDEGEAEGGDALDAEAGNQRAGDEARRVHAEHVPLQAERGVGDRMIAHDHGERRRGHHHVHHRIGRDAAGDRHDEARLPAISDSGRPSPTAERGGGFGMFSNISTAGRDQGERGLADIGRGEEVGRPQILGGDDELRADDGAEDAAEQHPRDRLRPEFSLAVSAAAKR